MVLNSLALGFEWEETKFEVVETFQSSVEACEKLEFIRPDLILSDIKMPVLTGLELMEKIKPRLPLTKFIFITGHEEFAFVRKAMQLGASGYVLKPIEDDEIIENLNKVELELENGNLEMENLIEQIVSDKNVKREHLLIQTFQKICVGEVPFDLAISIGSVAEELSGYVSYHEWKFKDNVFFYIIFDSEFLRNDKFTRRIRQLLMRQRITNFKYVSIQEWNQLHGSIRLLMNEVYSFFLKTPCFEDSFEVKVSVGDEKSQFYQMLEEIYRDYGMKDMVDVLSEYDERYPLEARTLEETVKIYNLVMTTLYRHEHKYFDKPIHSVGEMASSFGSIDDMMTQLLEEYGGRMAVGDDIKLSIIKNDTFKQVLTYINLNFTKEISFQQICNMHQINPSYLSQIFKREIGVTFTQYLTELRINYSKGLLKNSGMTISEISEKSGYQQYFYFAKIFKKTVGISPSQYRKEHQ